MVTTEHVLTSLTEMDRYIRLMATASGAGGIIDAVNAYLADWSTDRIRSLQKVDGGWGPFDERQQCVPLNGVADVARIADSVRRQSVALREVGIAPTTELLELDLFFFFARQIVEDHVPACCSPSAAARCGESRRHWPERKRGDAGRWGQLRVAPA